MVTPVHVYTSGDEAELFLNGQSLGRIRKKPYEYRLCWEDVQYTPGELKVIVYRKGREWAKDVVQTAGSAARLELSADRTVLNADGRDLAFISVTIVDKDGKRVPSAGHQVRFGVSGPGTIAAVGNGDPTNHQGFNSGQYNAFHGQCLVIIRSTEGKSGSIRLTAESDALAGGSVVLMARE